jgi:transcriptional regulator with XRE-family HTH domain
MHLRGTMKRIQKRYQKRSYRVLTELRAIRKTRDIKLKVLSHQIGYHPMTIGRWERGETTPSLQALNDWCEALNAKLSAIPRKDA